MRIGRAPIRVDPSAIPKDHQVARTVFCAVVAGSAMRSIAALRFATTLTLIAATTLLASALCSSRSQLADCLTLPMSKYELFERNERGARDAAPGEWRENNEKAGEDPNINFTS